MNLSAPFIRRPIATTLLAIGLAIAGIIAFNLLPVAPLPQVEFPTIYVQASLPGASAENMATSVATPLERQFGRIAGITQMTSASSLGMTRIIIQFDLSRNIDGAARDVQAAINAAHSQLPANLPNNPFYRKVNPSDAPIIILSLTSDTYNTGQMYDMASTILQQKLSQVEGVGQVMVGGSSLPAVRVDLNPNALSKYGIGLNQVRTAIASANANLAKGQISKGTMTSEIITNDQLFKAYQYQPLIISYQNGNTVKLSDVATVTDSVEDIRNAGLENDKPAVVLIIFKQPDANVIKTVDRVNSLIPQLRATIPTAVQIGTVMDRTTTIRASLHDVELTLIIALILVILVVYVFLRNIYAMIIPGVAVSLSLLGTFVVMQLLGYSLDNLSLMALTISTGFVIDDAIVVLENTMRHLEAGVSPIQAALDGAKEVGFTVVSMSLSLIAVFIPILLMGGIVGRIFREFSITLAVAILISLLVSLTLTPMMCSRLLDKSASHTNKKLHHHIKRFDTLRTKYADSLSWALRHPRLMLFATFTAIALNIVLYIYVSKGFIPQQDTGRITASIVGEQNISFQAMRDKLTAYMAIVTQDPAVQTVGGFVGNGTVNTGTMFITLKPFNLRKISADEVINRLRKKLAVVTGANLYMQSAQDWVIGGRQGNAQFQYTLSADSLEELNHWAPLVLAKLAKLPGIADVNSDQRDHGLQVAVNINHDTAARLGVSSQAIDAALYGAFGQSQISTMYSNLNQYHVVMEVAPIYWQNPITLNAIYVASNSGKLVPLSAMASFAPTNTLLSVNHQGQLPSATFSFNLLPNVALGDAVNSVAKAVQEMRLPITIQGAFQGAAQAFQSSLSGEPFLILAALITVYLVLGILYESTIHPITILSTLPSAGVGALLALLLTKTDLSLIAIIGIILLIGIVKKNAIMMIDFALDAERQQHKNTFDSIYQAAILRFRPILMTTAAALLGALPLALGHGVGAELRQPLGIAIIGGLIVSQILTLYSTPVIYLYMDRFAHKAKKKLKSKE